jgi:hypothetical protein
MNILCNVKWIIKSCISRLPPTHRTYRNVCPGMIRVQIYKVESSWNLMAHGDARVGKWRGNWRMEWVASPLHTTSEHGVSSITTADAHTSAASSRLNWRPREFKWTRPFRRKTKSDFCACAITFQMQANKVSGSSHVLCVFTADVSVVATRTVSYTQLYLINLQLSTPEHRLSCLYCVCEQSNFSVVREERDRDCFELSKISDFTD